MPRKKRKRKVVQQHELLIFEIKAWEPSYSLSLNREIYAEIDYSEHAELHLDTVCVYPVKFAGRTASVIASSRRGLFEPPKLRREPDDKAKDVGLLELPPSGGNFYGGVPHETMPFLLSALAAGQFHYVMVSGPPLVRSRGFCTQLHFARTAD